MRTTSPGAGGFAPDDYASLIVQPVQDEAVAFQVATQITTDATRTHLPIVKEDAGAGWVHEGDEIPVEDATLGEEIVTPAKVAGLTVVSSELAEDSNPQAQQIVGQGLARSIARQVDAAFFGTLPHPAPPGLESVPGVTTVAAGKKWTNLDPFLDAIAKAETVGATLTSFTAHPADALALAQLKEQTGSSKPLLGSDPTAPTRRVIAGVPLYVSPAVTPGTVWGLPKDRVFIVLRRDAKVDLSSDAYFNSDQIAVRGTMRIGYGHPHPAAITKVTLTA
ncbi:phage major capsid protein [Streptomyces cavernicola]|uniref:Phage major capsid protein n=1 Tax=Streptomyces cavernicola TaxID=3043613 RepID=A0ABT6SKF3_9ACTN|nr:phage major capsid protein [Streptomyces sp. B-S-A6]MDI3408420.1 phage major capsid protein [Streptomyces sp. B-S-A6]